VKTSKQVTGSERLVIKGTKKAKQRYRDRHITSVHFSRSYGVVMFL